MDIKNPESGQKHLVKMEQSIATIADPSLKQVLTRVMGRLKNTDLNKEVESFKKEVVAAPVKPTQRVLAFLPHQMAKTSIFFPMSDRELKEESRKINRLEHETGWGKIVIEGIKLAIFEEDVFLALLYLTKDKNKIKKTKEGPALVTNMKDVVNLLYGRAGYTKKSTERIEKTLEHFQLARFELTTYDWKKKGKERLKTRTVRSIGSVVSSYMYNEKTKELNIYFNPHFFAYFLESMLTNIDFTLRRRLKRDGSKALLRFLSTHNKPDRMHILTVLNAINFNTNQPMFRLRSRLKQFITELKKYDVLGPRTKLGKDDVVYFDILLSKKTLSD